jgi:hypothetical protein
MANTNAKRKSTNGILGLNESTGQWTKKINNVPRRFGAVTLDPTGDKAEALYFAEREAWERGENPRQQQARAASKAPMLLWEIVDRWRVMRRGLLKIEDENVRISAISYNGSFNATEKLLAIKGKQTNPLAWSQDDWKKLRADLGAKVSPYTKDQRIMYVRAMFSWAARNGLIPNVPAWGDEFEGVSKGEKEKHRYLYQAEHGARKFDVKRARKIIEATEAACDRRIDPKCNRGSGELCSHAEQKMIVGSRLLRACTYLAANTGAYSKDIACLTFDTFDLDAGYIETLRAKTSILWQAVLWKRTMVAIREYLEVRPKPAREEWAALVFLTAEGYPVNHGTERKDKDGNPRLNRSDALAQATGKLLTSLGVKDEGVNFGAWRHTFRSLVSGENADAIKRVMAHVFEGSEGSYTKLEEWQIKPVTDRAERLLWPEDFKSEGHGLRLVG